MLIMRLLALLVLCPAIAFGAVHGSPEPQYPGPSPHVWASLGNDNFLPGQPDDRLTGSLALGWQNAGLTLGAEYDMLTADGNGTRQDELTLTVGGVLWNEDQTRLVVSGGVRTFQPMNGDDTQNSVHRALGDNHLALQYDNSITTPIVMFDLYQYYPMVVGDDSVGFFWRGQDAFHARGNEIEAWGGPYYDCGDNSFLWVGAGYRAYRGDAYGATDRMVENAYQGWSFRSGIRLEHLTGTISIGRHAAYGEVGICF